MPRVLINVVPSRALSMLVGFLLALAGSLPAAADEDEASAWLERLGPALNMTSYRGVFVYARGESVHSMQIAHGPTSQKIATCIRSYSF